MGEGGLVLTRTRRAHYSGLANAQRLIAEAIRLSGLGVAVGALATVLPDVAREVADEVLACQEEDLSS